MVARERSSGDAAPTREHPCARPSELRRDFVQVRALHWSTEPQWVKVLAETPGRGSLELSRNSRTACTSVRFGPLGLTLAAELGTRLPSGVRMEANHT